MNLYRFLLVLFCGILPLAAFAGTPSFKRGVNISHWLSQNSEGRPYAAAWFNEEDVAWIATQGFDHIRYPIDGRIWLRPDGSLDEAKIAPFERALVWSRKHGLNVILDMHFLPGASFDPQDKQATAFTDAALQAKVAELWRQVAKRFAREGDYLRFEILNEPVAPENQMLNAFNRVMLAAIRESNPKRVVYLTSNRWSAFSSVTDVALPDDPHIALTLHFYEPMIFTHQRANWVQCPPDMPLVKFPGAVPDLSALFPNDHYLKHATPANLTVAQIDEAFAKVAAWAKANAPHTEIHIGEFGVYAPADAASKRAYCAAVVHAAESRGWGWAVWDYQGGFAVRDQEGKPTPILEGLFSR